MSRQHKNILIASNVVIAIAILWCIQFPNRASAQKNKDKKSTAKTAWSIPWETDWITATNFLGSSRKLAAGNKRGQILVWELPEDPNAPLPKPSRLLDGHTNTITALASSPDGRWLVSTSYDHTIRLWDMHAPAPESTTIKLMRDRKKRGRVIKTAPLIKVAVQKAERIFTDHDEWIRCMSLSPDGKRLLTGDDNGTVILRSIPSGKELRRFKALNWVQAVALAPNQPRLMTSEAAPRSRDLPNAVKIWNSDSGKVAVDLTKRFIDGRRRTDIIAAGFSPDGKILALGQGGEVAATFGKVFLLDAKSGKNLRELPAHREGVTGLRFHPDGKRLATCGRDTVVRLWRISDGKKLAEFGKGRGGQFRDWIHDVAFSVDGRWMAAGDMAGIIHVWHIGE